MDLYTLTYVAIVVFFSFLSMLFISRFLPMGKSFEEMVKEKREMRKRLLDLTAPSPTTTTTAKSSKDSVNKKTKKPHSANQNQKNRAAKQQQQQRVEVVERESDDNSSDNQQEEEINLLSYGAKKRTGQTTNLTVEYSETEAFSLSDNSSGNKKKDNKQQQQQQHGGKKNKQKSAGGGILVNKAEPVLVTPVESVPEINHFAEIHPKDALEIARQQKHEEEAKTGAGKHQQPKEQRHGNKHKKEHPVKMSPKNQAVEEQQPQHQQQLQLQQQQQFVASVVEVKKQEITKATAAHKDKSAKKKKNELITQELAAEVADAINVQTLVNILNKADLPRNDIQILIDFLLNKQQDTLAKDPSEWNDPSDPLQKLKKQLQEKESALAEEQKAGAGLQAKLKELRQELNGEKMQTGATLKAYLEELNNKKQEVHHLTLELASQKDKAAAEKHTLSYQFQQLQAKYIQLSKEHASTQDQGSTVAQLNNDLQLLQQELMAKSQLLNEKLQSEEELMKKKTEYEILLHNSEELLRQRVQKLTAYENELHQLRMELAQKDELNKTCQQQSYENEQLKAELQAKQKQAAAAASAAAAAAVANSQADESNRVEIRNLQNALDSTKSKLEVYRTELVECKSLLTDYKQQANELKAKEEQLQKQLDEQRQKNDNLRTKNWKLVEALQDAERRRGPSVAGKTTTMTTATTTTAAASATLVDSEKVEQQQKLLASTAEKPVDVGKIVLEEQNRTKDLLVKLLQPTGVVPTLPVDATDFQSWLEATVGCIKERQEELQRKHHTNSTSTTTTTNATATTTTSSSNTSNSNSRSSSNTNANNNLNTNNNTVNNSLHENSNDAHANDDDDAVVVVGGGDANKNGATDSGSEDEQQALALRNEQLQKTVDQYKTIIADTENMLKNLEAQVIEQDIHWRSVVQAKDKELTLLKSAGAIVQ